MIHVSYTSCFMNPFKNCMKSLEVVLNTIFFCFQNFSKRFHEYIRAENPSLKIAWNYSKNHLSCFKYNIFYFQNFSKTLYQYIRYWLFHSNLYKQKYWEKVLKSYTKEPIFKDKKFEKELEKKFIELKDREVKIKKR